MSPGQGSTQVDVVIACHSPQRPLGRAVASLLEGNGSHVRPMVVAHNIAPDLLQEQVLPAHRDRVTFLELRDGIRSPAGPFNAGLEAATAAWVSIMGSDDILEPGAVASWLDLQRATGADAVLTRLALGSPDRTVATPPVRPLRRGLRSLALDRLAYRSAPLGLLRRDTVQELDLRMVQGRTVGEDVPFMTRLCAQARIAVSRRGPGYVIGEDATDRVTYEVRGLDEQLGFFADVLAAPWFAALPVADRTAIGVKFLRIHVFGAVHYRPDPTWWSDAERAELARSCLQVLTAAPQSASPLSRAERRLLDACLDPTVPASALVERSAARRRHGRPSTLLVRDARSLLHPEAPPRFMSASAVARLLR